MPALPVPHLFTVEEYERMAEAGIFPPDVRLELLEGEIVEMAAIGSRDAAGVDRLNRFFTQALGTRAIVRVRGPVRLRERSEPEPDIALLRDPGDFYESVHPDENDVFLLAEVADSSVGFDRRRKVPLYARAGVPEVWLVDLVASTIEVYRQPQGGSYVDVERHRAGAHVSPLAFADVSLAVADVLP